MKSATPAMEEVGHTLNLVRQGQEADNDNANDKEDVVPSAWLVSPYFFIYFSVFVINSTVWPVQLLEWVCRSKIPQVERLAFTNAKPENSCITSFITPAQSNDTIVSAVYSTTTNIMVTIAIIGGLFSVGMYVLLWKPLLENFRGFSVLLPPVIMLGQSFLMAYAQSQQDNDNFKIALGLGILLSSLHGGWQGVFLLFFHLTDPEKQETKKILFTTKLDGSHGTVFFGMFFAGVLITSGFDMSFVFLSFFQFTLVAVNILYAVALVPHGGSLLSGNEQHADMDEVQPPIKVFNEGDSSGSEEDLLLMNAVQHRKESISEEKWWKIANPLKEARLIFSESSYQIELILVIEVCVFTIALMGDTDIGVFYVMDIWHTLDFHSIGMLIAAQGGVKIIGLVIIKVIIYHAQVKHGSCITLSLASYVLYYAMLACATSKKFIAASMFVNIFGALAFPAIFSFLKINLPETTETVIDCSMVVSYIVAILFGTMKLFVYNITRAMFPGASFALTASILLICGLMLIVTYFTSSIKNRRKSKDSFDKLLNTNQ